MFNTGIQYIHVSVYMDPLFENPQALADFRPIDYSLKK